ncbi:hypothetical protein Landi51_04915 [Colletotrichum acutatum]
MDSAYWDIFPDTEDAEVMESDEGDEEVGEDINACSPDIKVPCENSAATAPSPTPVKSSHPSSENEKIVSRNRMLSRSLLILVLIIIIFFQSITSPSSFTTIAYHPDHEAGHNSRSHPSTIPRRLLLTRHNYTEKHTHRSFRRPKFCSSIYQLPVVDVDVYLVNTAADDWAMGWGGKVVDDCGDVVEDEV